MLIAVSKIYKHGVNYVLRHITADASPPTNGSWSGAAPDPESSDEGGLSFEAQLEPRDDGTPQARLGVDPFSVDVDGTVTKTSWPTLTLPDGVGASSTFAVTFRGKAGILTIGAAPDDQHPKTVNKIGAEFRGRWQANG